MTPSRRYLFALGLALPIAAFTVSAASAATSSPMHHKTHGHHAVSAVHKGKSHHTMHMHNVAHHTMHSTPHKPAAS